MTCTVLRELVYPILFPFVNGSLAHYPRFFRTRRAGKKISVSHGGETGISRGFAWSATGSPKVIEWIPWRNMTNSGDLMLSFFSSNCQLFEGKQMVVGCMTLGPGPHVLPTVYLPLSNQTWLAVTSPYKRWPWCGLGGSGRLVQPHAQFVGGRWLAPGMQRCQQPAHARQLSLGRSLDQVSATRHPSEECAPAPWLHRWKATLSLVNVGWRWIYNNYNVNCTSKSVDDFLQRDASATGATAAASSGI